MNKQKPKGLAILIAGMVVGFFLGTLAGTWWPQFPVQAMATHGQDNFAIATGFVDSQNEALFFLDFLTGELKATVPSRTTGAFLSFFHYNIAQDFGGSQSKNPKYLMVTGRADFGGNRGNSQIGQTVVYIAEATSGIVAAYGIPWNRSLQQAHRPQSGSFMLLDKKPFRQAIIRDN